MGLLTMDSLSPTRKSSSLVFGGLRMILFFWFLCGLIAALGFCYVTPAGERMRDLKKNFAAYLFVLASGPINIIWAVIYMAETRLLE